MQEREFEFLPAYAAFLLENKVEELAVSQLRIARDVRLPLLAYMADQSDEKLIALGRDSMRLLLDAMLTNDMVGYIERSSTAFLSNRISTITRNQVRSEDIMLISYMRRKVLRDSLDTYTKDFKLAAKIMEEIDWFLTRLDGSSHKRLLESQEHLYEQAQKIANIGNWRWDLTTNTITWSNELFRIYELEPQSKVTYDLAAFNHPDDLEMVKEQMRLAQETGSPQDFFYRIVLKDGKQKFLHAKGEVVLGEDGKATSMFGTLQDVTSQKKLEEDRMESEYFIRKVTELTPSLITVYDIRSGEYLFVNEAIEQLLGYSAEYALEKGVDFFISITHPDDIKRIMEENQKALERANLEPGKNSEQIVEFKYRIRNSQGVYKWFHTYGTVFERDINQKVEKVINISMDITDETVTHNLLQQRNEQIKEQEDRYFRMINEVEDYAILRLSREGLIENWNSGAEKIKGYSSAEIIGKHFRIFYPESDRENQLPEALIERAVLEGRATHEGWRVRKNKSKFWGSVVITALHDQNGKIVGFSKVTRDLTQKKIAEDSLKQYAANLESKNKELELKNDELESFNYVASHDLQEPIRKIRIWSNRIEEDSGLADKTRHFVSRIEHSCIRMQSLIEGLLTYSQNSNREASREPVDLNIIVEEVLQEMVEALDKRKLLIEKAVLPTLPVDKIQFRQLFSNLISNAIKYSKSEGEIDIRIGYNVDNDFHQLSFQDNGIGFKQEYADKIFELFQRLHDRRTYTGTGLGLAICKKIVENHGGKITAVGEPGVGSTFNVYLPV